MNAIQFIQQNGIEKAREVVEGAPEKATVVSAETFGYFYKYQGSPVWGRVYRRKDGSEWSCTRFSPIINPIELSDLKHLVESVDLVKSYGGIINAKHDVKYLDLDWDYDTQRVKRLKQAIADYESIYSGEEH